MADEEGPSYSEVHGRIEYWRGRQEALEGRVDRLELAINSKLNTMDSKLDVLAAKFAEKMEDVTQHIAGVTARGGVATAVWGTLGGSCLLVAWEVIQFFVLKK